MRRAPRPAVALPAAPIGRHHAQTGRLRARHDAYSRGVRCVRKNKTKRKLKFTVNILTFASEKLLASKVSGLAVVDHHGRLVGQLSASDLKGIVIDNLVAEFDIPLSQFLVRLDFLDETGRERDSGSLFGISWGCSSSSSILFSVPLILS